MAGFFKAPTTRGISLLSSTLIAPEFAPTASRKIRGAAKVRLIHHGFQRLRFFGLLSGWPARGEHDHKRRDGGEVAAKAHR